MEKKDLKSDLKYDIKNSLEYIIRDNEKKIKQYKIKTEESKKICELYKSKLENFENEKEKITGNDSGKSFSCSHHDLQLIQKQKIKLSSPVLILPTLQIF